MMTPLFQQHVQEDTHVCTHSMLGQRTCMLLTMCVGRSEVFLFSVQIPISLINLLLQRHTSTAQLSTVVQLERLQFWLS
jgi:hypothetical protein